MEQLIYYFGTYLTHACIYGVVDLSGFSADAILSNKPDQYQNIQIIVCVQHILVSSRRVNNHPTS